MVLIRFLKTIQVGDNSSKFQDISKRKNAKKNDEKLQISHFSYYLMHPMTCATAPKIERMYCKMLV